MSARRKSLNRPGMFCFVCEEFALIKQRCFTTQQIKKSNLWYFGVQIRDQDKLCALHIASSCCCVKIIHWENGISESCMV